MRMVAFFYEGTDFRVATSDKKVLKKDRSLPTISEFKSKVLPTYFPRNMRHCFDFSSTRVIHPVTKNGKTTLEVRYNDERLSTFAK